MGTALRVRRRRGLRHGARDVTQMWGRRRRGGPVVQHDEDVVGEDGHGDGVAGWRVKASEWRQGRCWNLAHDEAEAGTGSPVKMPHEVSTSNNNNLACRDETCSSKQYTPCGQHNFQSANHGDGGSRAGKYVGVGYSRLKTGEHAAWLSHRATESRRVVSLRSLSVDCRLGR